MSDIVQNPELDYQAGDLGLWTCVTVSYKGDNFTVYVVEPLRPKVYEVRRDWGRYLYKEQRYKSLSAVARKITGDPSMSGNRFFKLRRRRRGRK